MIPRPPDPCCARTWEQVVAAKNWEILTARDEHDEERRQLLEMIGLLQASANG